MLDLRRLFYDGSTESELAQSIAQDLHIVDPRLTDALDSHQWLAMSETRDSDAAFLKDRDIYWLLIAKLQFREKDIEQARDSAFKAISLATEPCVRHWAWRLLQHMGHKPQKSEQDQVLGAAFEHWIPETDGWGMVCTYSDASPRLYLSWGAGITGNVTVPSVRAKAKTFLSEAEKMIASMSLIEAPPLPERGEMTLRVLTPLGIRTGTDTHDRIENGKGPFAAVGLAAAELIGDLMEASGE